MKLKIGNRIGALATAGVMLTGALTLVPASPAAAAGPWELQVCSRGSFPAEVSWGGGSNEIPQGQCKSVHFQPFGPDRPVVHFTFWAKKREPGSIGITRFIAGASVDLAQGGVFSTAGTFENPYVYPS
jgi:hypothetical protein